MTVSTSAESGWCAAGRFGRRFILVSTLVFLTLRLLGAGHYLRWRHQWGESRPESQVAGPPFHKGDVFRTVRTDVKRLINDA